MNSTVLLWVVLLAIPAVFAWTWFLYHEPIAEWMGKKFTDLFPRK